MASLRRNKTLSPDGQTARFLYTIIKQLDLKAIDWNLVAGSLDITNGHAARMRYSRFKQHMEGATTQPRAPRTPKKEKEVKEGKEGKEGVKKGKKRGFEEDGDDRKEAPTFMKSEIGQDGAGVNVKTEGGGRRVKNEPDADTTPYEVQIKREPGPLQDVRAAVGEATPAVRVKPEPDVDDTTNPDIWHILPRSTGGQASLQDQMPRSTQIPASALTTRAYPLLRHLSPTTPPPQSTVSLAELEVSPRSRPAALTGPDPTVPHSSSFTHRAGLVPQRVPAGLASDGVQIKPEPGIAVDEDWMICQPSAGVVVKSEPMEA
jgi:hypothetical protein